MKAYKVELLIIDHGKLGPHEIASVLENTRISPSVEEITGRDIGGWTDNHPLNLPDQCEGARSGWTGRQDSGVLCEYVAF